MNALPNQLRLKFENISWNRSEPAESEWNKKKWQKIKLQINYNVNNNDNQLMDVNCDGVQGLM